MALSLRKPKNHVVADQQPSYEFIEYRHKHILFTDTEGFLLPVFGSAFPFPIEFMASPWAIVVLRPQHFPLASQPNSI